MATAAKTQAAPLDRDIWLQGVDPARRDEAGRLLAIFAEETGWEARLWGPSMIGFGRYVYRYDSGHGGESLATGFSPRKADLSLYGLIGTPATEALLPGLGPHRAGKGCLYVKRLAEVDETVLRALIRAGLEDLRSRWEVHPV